MTTQEKKDKIKELVAIQLEAAYRDMARLIDKALNSGAIDIDGWDEKDAPMVLPNCIATAILEQECTQFDGSGTGYEKRVKKEVKNIRYFL